jgi:hypothetical protein
MKKLKEKAWKKIDCSILWTESNNVDGININRTGKQGSII